MAVLCLFVFIKVQIEAFPIIKTTKPTWHLCGAAKQKTQSKHFVLCGYMKICLKCIQLYKLERQSMKNLITDVFFSFKKGRHRDLIYLQPSFSQIYSQVRSTSVKVSCQYLFPVESFWRGRNFAQNIVYQIFVIPSLLVQCTLQLQVKSVNSHITWCIVAGE